MPEPGTNTNAWNRLDPNLGLCIIPMKQRACCHL